MWSQGAGLEKSKSSVSGREENARKPTSVTGWEERAEKMDLLRKPEQLLELNRKAHERGMHRRTYKKGLTRV